MEITRDNVQIKLTDDELNAAHKAFALKYMKKELMETFQCTSEQADELALLSYERYEKDDFTSYSMFEAIESVVKEHEQEYVVTIEFNGKFDIRVKAFNVDNAVFNAESKASIENIKGARNINFDAISIMDKNGNVVTND